MATADPAPHHSGFLRLSFWIVTVIAFFAILFTTTHPKRRRVRGWQPADVPEQLPPPDGGDSSRDRIGSEHRPDDQRAPGCGVGRLVAEVVLPHIVRRLRAFLTHPLL